MPSATRPFGETDFRLIADFAPVPMWVTELDRRRSFVNRAYAEFLGLPHDEALHFDWRTIIHPDDAERIAAASLIGEAGLKSFTLEARYRRHDGEWRWLKSVSQPRFDEDGRHVGFIGVAQDDTEAQEATRAAREREEQLSAFVSQSTAGFAQVDVTGRFTLVNDRFCEITGRSREDLLQRTMQSITHPADLPANLPRFQAIIADGTPYTHEKRYIRPDGSSVWVNNSVAVIRRADGEPYGVLAVTLDVSDRRESETALRRTEESIRLAIEGANMATWEFDLATLEGEWSPNRFGLLGMPRPERNRGTVKQWLARIHPDDLEYARSTLSHCVETGEPYTIEYRILRADTGEERWLQSHGSRIDHEDGRPSRFVGVSFDVTPRKLAEVELRESETRFRTIFEQASDYIFTSTLDQRILSSNPAVANALGYSQEELVGRPFSDFLDTEQAAHVGRMLQHRLMGGGTTTYTVRVRDRLRRELVWDVSSRLVRGADGLPTGLFAIARDVTEAKRAEALQRLLIDELNHRVKNTLAIVQGISQQTFGRGVDPIVGRAKFEGRLSALSKAHSLLTQENWGPVPLVRIIHDTVAPHGGDLGRFVISGPDLMLAPKTAISIALAVHELATNAVKHGALSQQQGRVEIRWSTYVDEGQVRLRFEWIEQGGPPVTPPTSRGFGTRMIERGLAAELAGTVDIVFQREGLRCIVDAPLPDALA